jgi:hypothetical protein
MAVDLDERFVVQVVLLVYIGGPAEAVAATQVKSRPGREIVHVVKTHSDRCGWHNELDGVRQATRLSLAHALSTSPDATDGRWAVSAHDIVQGWGWPGARTVALSVRPMGDTVLDALSVC